MLHFLIGTKAQFIKLVPLMYQLQKEQIEYNLVNLSQHGYITTRFIEDFELKPIKIISHEKNRVVSTYVDALKFTLYYITQVIKGRKYLLHHYFNDDKNGWVIIHGDTLSTLIGLSLGKRSGLPVALVEAGLTSRRLFNPFPEEMIRRIAERYSNHLFSPGSLAESNLINKKLRGRIVNTEYNTGKDALDLTYKIYKDNVTDCSTGYLLVTLHRFETISNKNNLEKLLNYIIKISSEFHETRLFMHQPTENALKRFGLYKLINKSENFKLYPLLPYHQFAFQLRNCQAIITDGGSIQEEAYYLKKPCIILRKNTERTEGLGANARLMTGNTMDDTKFLKQKPTYNQLNGVNTYFYATNKILNTLLEST